MIGIDFLGTYRNCRADLPTAHCRLYLLSVVIPPMIALHRFLIPLTSLPLYAHSCTWIVAIGFAFLLLLFILDATHLNISATLTIVPILITALGCGDIINSLSEVSMPFRAKGHSKFPVKIFLLQSVLFAVNPCALSTLDACPDLLVNFNRAQRTVLISKSQSYVKDSCKFRS